MTPPDILLTDDDAATRDIWGTSLSRAGYRVALAASGREALRRVRSGAPRLLLLDLILPDMNGLEVVRALRSEPGCERLLVVAFTARMPSEAERPARAAGCHGFLAKPVTPAEVVSEVRRFIGGG